MPVATYAGYKLQQHSQVALSVLPPWLAKFKKDTFSLSQSWLSPHTFLTRELAGKGQKGWALFFFTLCRAISDISYVQRSPTTWKLLKTDCVILNIIWFICVTCVPWRAGITIKTWAFPSDWTSRCTKKLQRTDLNVRSYTTH